MYKETDQIFVRINRGGYIPYINMCGPIPNPIKVSTAICLKLVNAGIDVHQYDPVTKESVKLTRENVFNDAKFAKRKVVNTANTKAQTVKPSSTINFTGIQKKDEPTVEKEAEVDRITEVEKKTETQPKDNNKNETKEVDKKNKK